MTRTINTAASMLGGAIHKKIIIFFSDGGFGTSGLSGTALSITRVGIAFGGGSYSNTVALSGGPGVTGDSSLAFSAPSGSTLTTIFNKIIVTQTTSGNLTGIDADGDGDWPTFCQGVPNTLCGRPHPLTGGIVTCTDTYDSPADFGVSPLEVEPSTGKTWKQLFSEADDDLDKDGERYAAGRSPVGFPDIGTGKDWYDHPFTSDLSGLSVKPNLAQLANTINDLDLDGYIAAQWKLLYGSGAELSEPGTADVRIVGGSNIAGCVFPTALEDFCADCTAYIPDPGTGRVPPGKTSPTSPPGPTKNVCQIEAYYVNLVTSTPPYEIIKSGTVNAGRPLILASVQCKDGIDNNLDGLTDDFAPNCPKDIVAPTIHTFTVDDVNNTKDPVLVNSGSVELKWTASDNAGGSGIDHAEIWIAAFAAGTCDESTKSGCDWGATPVIVNANSPETHSPGGGTWWYGVHVIDDDGNCITEAGTHCGGVSADVDDTRSAVGPIMVILDTEPPVVSFDIPPSPADGTVLRGDNFDIRFDVTDTNPLNFCKIFTSVNGGAAWTERRTITSCSGVTSLLDHTETLDAAWCPVAGPANCGVAVQAQDLVTNLGRAEVFYTMNQPPTLTMMLPPPPMPFSTLPFSLTPTASDDGLLNSLTFLWEKVSGPGSAIFSSETILDPTVTFDNIGTYKLKLTVNDGFFTDSAEISLTITHEPPVANAGPSKSIDFGLPSVSTNTEGSATDDGFLDPLTYKWRQLSGPEPVTFADDTSLMTQVTFTASGDYELELEADDGEYTDADIVLISIINARPDVDAGPANMTVEFLRPTVLTGSVFDDGLPSPPSTLDILWTRLDGPGTYTITDEKSPSAELSFSQAGLHIFELTAFDGELTGSNIIEITYEGPDNYGLVPCGTAIDDPSTEIVETIPCSLCHILVLIHNIVMFLLVPTTWNYGFAAVMLLGVLLIVISGVLLLVGGLGAPHLLARGKKILFITLLSLLFIYGMWIGIDLILDFLGFATWEGAGTWWQIRC